MLRKTHKPCDTNITKLLESAQEAKETELYFNDGLLSAAGLTELVRFFKEKRPQFSVLHLNNNKIDVNGAYVLADFLLRDTTLTRLNLDNNTILQKGAVALFRALKHNKTLTALSLCNNGIVSGAGIKDCPNHLVELNVSGNFLTIVDMTAFLANNPTLEHLIAQDNSINLRNHTNPNTQLFVKTLQQHNEKRIAQNEKKEQKPQKKLTLNLTGEKVDPAELEYLASKLPEEDRDIVHISYNQEMMQKSKEKALIDLRCAQLSALHRDDRSLSLERKDLQKTKEAEEHKKERRQFFPWRLTGGFTALVDPLVDTNESPKAGAGAITPKGRQRA